MSLSLAGDGTITGIDADASDLVSALGGIGSNVVSVSKVNAFTTTSTSFVDIPDMTASITPTSNTAKVLVVCQLSVGGRNDQRMFVNLLRGETNLNQSTGGTLDATISMGMFPNEEGIIPVIISFLDSPATTSATTYKLQIRTTASSTTVNRSRASVTAGSTSTITLIEVAA